MKKIIFSVVIPAYNRGAIIETTIGSVINQTTSSEFELIIVDDGSTDNTRDIVLNVNDSRIRYIYQPNAGANVARNRGIDEAQGLYIAMLDSDDKFLPNHLKNAYTVLQRKPSAVLYSRIIVDRGNGNRFLKPPRALNEGEHIAEYMLCDRGFLQTSTLIIPIQLARSVRYMPGLPFGQDTDFAIRLFHTGAEFIMQDEPGAVWLDVHDVGRISSNSSAIIRTNWLEGVKHMISHKAYVGDLGWFVAKSYAKQRNYGKALSLYFKAISQGCYSPKLSAIIFLQITIGNRYRYIADLYVSITQFLKGRT